MEIMEMMMMIDDDYVDEYLLKLDRLLKNLKDDKNKEELEAEKLDGLL